MEEPARYVATVTSKGQLTVPVELRRDLGLRQGDQVVFAREEAGVYTVRKAVDAAAVERVFDKWASIWRKTERGSEAFVEEVRGPLEDGLGSRRSPTR